MKDWETNECALTVHDLADFLALPIPPRDLLLAPWLESSSLAMVYAKRGVGKTHFAMNLAYALATGGRFLKWQAPKPVPVLYVDGEMPATGMQARWRTIQEAATAEPGPNMLRVISRETQSFQELPNLGTEKGQEIFAAKFGDAKVVILDNLSSLIFGAKENEAEGWEPVGHWAIKERARGRTLIFIHHAGKSGGQRGSSKREDLLDAVIQLENPAGYKQEEGARFIVKFEKARSLAGPAVAPFEARLGLDSGEWAIADDAGELLALRESGLSFAEIGERLGIDKATAKRRFDRIGEPA